MSPPLGSAKGQINRPRRPLPLGPLNLIGDLTLFRRGTLRYWRMGWNSLAGPCVSALLFLTVFLLAADGTAAGGGAIALGAFVAPGIVVFSLCQNGFENAGFSLMEDKQEGMIGDLLVAPLRAIEIMLGYVLPGACSALATGLLVFCLTLIFVDYSPVAPLLGLAYAAATALLFALFGTLAALWGQRWEHYSAAETFVVLPLAFLSGTFFSLDRLTGGLQVLVMANPVFHAVNGLRYALTGYQEASLALGGLVLLLANGGLLALLWWLFRRGYNIKA